jgi:hypothetical protein
MVGLDATERTKLHIKQGKALHAKIRGLNKKCKKTVKFVEERGGVFKVRTRGGKR